MNETYHAYRLHFRARTYDSDHAEDTLVSLDFETEALLRSFLSYFPTFCKLAGIITEVNGEPVVEFSDLEKYIDEHYHNSGLENIRELLRYDSGWIWIEKVKATEVSRSDLEIKL
jgi:hypothetical protein